MKISFDRASPLGGIALDSLKITACKKYVKFEY